GYSFCGWGDVPATMPAHSVDLYAIWCVNSYEVRYKVNNEVVHTEMVAYGAALPDYTPDEVEGYSFCGWGDVPATMPDHDVELTAQYCVNSYELKYIVEGETVFTSQVAYGASLPNFVAPVIDGYVFLYWEGEEYDTMPAHAVTYTAHYVKKGDVNLDGYINTADVVAVYSYIISGDESGVDRDRADVNNDGYVNTADVTAIYYIITYGN
ncbi:MAG: InlB B-repeat-containing protein, partial [Bacteroidaceae bacterium]|nr:InlB B-repeat-containing protein [Bacteroidaceae bacterium]